MHSFRVRIRLYLAVVGHEKIMKLVKQKKLKIFN